MVEYTPKWTNIPNRAAFHHFIRSARLESPGNGAVGFWASWKEDAAISLPANASNEAAPVPLSMLRRVNVEFPIQSSPDLEMFYRSSFGTVVLRFVHFALRGSISSNRP